MTPTISLLFVSSSDNRSHLDQHYLKLIKSLTAYLMDHKLILNPSDENLFDGRSTIYKSPLSMIISTQTHPASQSSHLCSAIHVLQHFVVYYPIQHLQPNTANTTHTHRVCSHPRRTPKTVSQQTLPTTSMFLQPLPLTFYPVLMLFVTEENRKDPVVPPKVAQTVLPLRNAMGKSCLLYFNVR